MKRLCTCILALTVLFSFAACSPSQPAGTGSTPGANNGNVAATGENDGSTTTPAATAAVISFQEVTVVDNEYCTIKITGIEPDNMWGYTLKAYLENKSADKTFMFSIDSASVNGVETDTLFATEVAAGKKSNEDISFMDSALEENNIGDFTDIALHFRVYDSNDWTAEPVATPSIHIYPYGEENAVAYTREAQPADNVIVDNAYVTVIVTGYEHDTILGYTANLFLVNKADVPVMFSVDEASVNGYMAEPFYADSVGAGNCAFSAISWSDTTLEENNITEIQTIEFLLRVYNEDDWTADDFVNETITLNP